MKLVLLLAWRHLVRQPGRTLASVLGIALGIATVLSVVTVDHNTLLSQAARRDPDDPGADLVLQPLLDREVDLEALSRELHERPWLSGSTAYATGTLTLTPHGRKAGTVELMALEAGAQRDHEAYAVAEGADLDFASEEPQLLVSAGVAEAAGIAVGDLVELARPEARRGPVTRCVGGELVVVQPRPSRGPAAEPESHPFRVVGVLAPTRLGYAKSRVLTTLDQGRAVLGDDFNPRFWADFDHGEIDFLGVEEGLRKHFVVYAPKRALAGEAPQEAAFRSGVRFCGLLALFLGLYIIFNTMSMSLVERVRQVGLLRALGVTRGRLLAMFLVEGLLLALAGALLSVALAERIVDFLQERRITTLGFGKPLEIREVPWAEAAAVIAAGVAFCLAGVLYPFLRASRLGVIEALRRGVIELSADPFSGVRRSVLLGLVVLVPVAWLLGAPAEAFVPLPLYHAILLGIALVAGVFALFVLLPRVLPALARAVAAPLRGPASQLARLTLASARQRVFAAVTGLMLVFAAVFLVLSVLESLKAETRRFGERALEQRIYLRTTPDGAERIGELRAAAGELRTLVPLNVEVHSPFVVRAVAQHLLQVGSLGEDVELRQAFATTPSVLLSTRCADDYDYAVGDTLTLSTAADGPVGFRVLAVTDEYGFAPDDRVWAAVSAPMMKRYWCLDSEGLGNYFVAWAPGLGPGRFEQLATIAGDVLGAGNVLDIRRGETIAGDYVTDLDRDFAIFYAILALTVLLAVVGILNAMVIAVLERRREIALLRSVGLTRGQVTRMLLVESGALGLLGGALALVLGVPLALITMRALTETSHLDLAFEARWLVFAGVFAGAVLVALLAVLLPAWRANRLRVAEAMRYE